MNSVGTLIWHLVCYSLFFNFFAVCRISDQRKCVDPDCSVPISEATTLLNYHANDERLLSFPPKVKATIYSKEAGDYPNFWEAEINGKRGYVPKSFMREDKVLVKSKNVKQIVPTGRVDQPKQNKSDQPKQNKSEENVNKFNPNSPDINATPKLPTANSKGWFQIDGVSADSVPPSSPDIKPQQSSKYEVIDGTTIYHEDHTSERIEQSPATETEVKNSSPSSNVPSLENIKHTEDKLLKESIQDNLQADEKSETKVNSQNDNSKKTDNHSGTDNESSDGIKEEKATQPSIEPTFYNKISNIISNVISSGAGENKEQDVDEEEEEEDEEEEDEDEGETEDGDEEYSDDEYNIDKGVLNKDTINPVHDGVESKVSGSLEETDSGDSATLVKDTKDETESSVLNKGTISPVHDGAESKANRSLEETDSGYSATLVKDTEDETKSSVKESLEQEQVETKTVVDKQENSQGSLNLDNLQINNNLSTPELDLQSDNLKINTVETVSSGEGTSNKVDVFKNPQTQDSVKRFTNTESESKYADNSINTPSSIKDYVDKEVNAENETILTENTIIDKKVPEKVSVLTNSLNDSQNQTISGTENKTREEVNNQPEISQEISGTDNKIEEEVTNNLEIKQEISRTEEKIIEEVKPHSEISQTLSEKEEKRQDDFNNQNHINEEKDIKKEELAIDQRTSINLYTDQLPTIKNEELDKTNSQRVPFDDFSIEPENKVLKSLSPPTLPEIEQKDAREKIFGLGYVPHKTTENGQQPEILQATETKLSEGHSNNRNSDGSPSPVFITQTQQEYTSKLSDAASSILDDSDVSVNKFIPESNENAVEEIVSEIPDMQNPFEENILDPIPDGDSVLPESSKDIIYNQERIADTATDIVPDDTEGYLSFLNPIFNIFKSSESKNTEEVQEVNKLLRSEIEADGISSDELISRSGEFDPSHFSTSSDQTCVAEGLGEGTCGSVEDIIKDVTWQESLYPPDMSAAIDLIDKVPLEITIWLIVTAVAVLIFSLGHYYIEAHRRDGSLVAVINKLEREVLILKKESCILEDRLHTAESQLETWNVNTSESDALIVELKQELEETKAVKTELEEQVAALEREVESVTENGLEMHRLLEESLSSQDGSQVLLNTVETLREKLERQEDEIAALSLQLNNKSSEVEELQKKLAHSADVAVSLEEKVIAVTRIKEEEALQLKEQHRLLMAQLEEVMETKALDETRVSAEMSQLRLAIEELQKSLAEKEAELDEVKEVVKQLRSTDSNERMDTLFDTVGVRAQLRTVTLERDDLREKFHEEEGARKLLEGHMRKITQEVAELKNSFETAEKEKIEALTKLQVLSNYFKEKESQLQKELGLQESMWLQKQSDDHTIYEQMRSLREENEKYKLQNESLKKEIVEQESSFKIQLANVEQKAHENWVTSRQAERRLKEVQQEAAQLRNKLTQNSAVNFSMEDGKPNISESNGDASSPPPSLMFPPTTSPPFMMYPPPGDFVPPPPLMGSPYPSDSRPPPLGRISSPPLDHRFSPPPPLPYPPYDYPPYGHHSPSPPPPLPSLPHHRNVHKPQPREMTREQKDHLGSNYSAEGEKRRNKR